ncbi:MAG: hypothetical protein EBZ59_07520 [Planctomycetia bacterium]|nr:hypothetical protein [Planctomycetia bacterium]
MSAARARLVAFYLPQFHPIPENDAWWGRGFTEWTNVSKAVPLFPGHGQPHIPADLGYYDLRVPETRLAQAELARAYGIGAFCYWHYWFEGRRLLERPFHEVLESGAPDFPFCLAWANETWSRRWLGEEKEILLRQTYSEADEERHARWLVGAFRDRRYLCVGDRPVFLVYRPLDLPDPRRFTDVVRRACRLAGLADPMLLGISSATSSSSRNWRSSPTCSATVSRSTTTPRRGRRWPMPAAPPSPTPASWCRGTTRRAVAPTASCSPTPPPPPSRRGCGR